MKAKAKNAVRYKGVRYAPGDVFECDNDTSAKLFRKGAIEFASKKEELSEGEVVPKSAHSLIPKNAPAGEIPSQRSGAAEDEGAEETEGETGDIPGLKK